MNRSDSRACHRCFRDKALISFIREEGKRSWCDWCGARNVYVAPLYMLGDIFREAAGIYQPSEWGDEQISFLLQEDWELFSDKIEQAPNSLMQEMAVAILKAGLTAKEYHCDYPDFDGGFRREEPWLEEHWDAMAEAFLSGKESSIAGPAVAGAAEEFFPDQMEIAFEDLLAVYEAGKVLYRARIHDDRYRKEKFRLDEMGAPAPKDAKTGRANRARQPVLYLANEDKTALCEVRAWKGAAVALAEMRIKRRLRIVNLLDIKTIESPFFDELLSWRLQLAGLFYRLSEELSRPIMTHEEKDLYRSTQYLCDCIKKADYDGVTFPSAMGKGFNVVVFDPSDAEAINLKYVRVDEMWPRFREFGEYEEIYEEVPYHYLFQKS